MKKLIALALFVLLLAGPAYAFTADNNSNAVSNNGAARFGDPDEEFDSSSSQGSGAPLSHLNFGNGTSATFGVTGPDNGSTNCTTYNCARSAIR